MRGTCSKVGKHGSQSLANPEASTKMEAPDAEKPLGRTNARHWHIRCAWSKISVMSCKLWFEIWLCSWYCNLLPPLQLCGTTAAVSNHLGRKKAKRMQKLQGQKAFLLLIIALQDSEPVGALITDDFYVFFAFFCPLLDQAREANKAVDAVKKAFDEAAAAVKGKAQHHGTAILQFSSLHSSRCFDIFDHIWFGPWASILATLRGKGEGRRAVTGGACHFRTSGHFCMLSLPSHIQSIQNSTTACQSHDVHIIYQRVWDYDVHAGSQVLNAAGCHRSHWQDAAWRCLRDAMTFDCDWIISLRQIDVRKVIRYEWEFYTLIIIDHKNIKLLGIRGLSILSRCRWSALVQT